MQEDNLQFIEIYLFTPSPFEKEGQVWPVRIGRNAAKANYHVGPRDIPFYSLHFVLSGSGTFVAGNKSYTLQGGDLFCLHPFQEQEYGTNSSDPIHMIWIAFEGRQGLQLCERIGLGTGRPHRSNVITSETREILNDFFQEARSSGANMPEMSKLAHFYRLFEHLARLSEGAEPEQSHWVQQGLDYMKANFAKGTTIEEVSREVNIDRTHFSKVFRQRYGVSPVHYLRQLRVDAAKLMLKESDSNLAEIAQSVGYPNAFSFSKMFKKHAGISPGAYRIECRR